MEEKLVSFHVAKLAKEKNFISECWGYYDNGGVFNHSMTKVSNQMKLIAAPTQSLLQKCLRDNNNIRVFVEQKVAGDFGFVIYILNPIKEERAGKPWIRLSHFTKHFPTYEDALDEGLIEGLNLIENEKPRNNS